MLVFLNKCKFFLQMSVYLKKLIVLNKCWFFWTNVGLSQILHFFNKCWFFWKLHKYNFYNLHIPIFVFFTIKVAKMEDYRWIKLISFSYTSYIYGDQLDIQALIPIYMHVKVNCNEITKIIIFIFYYVCMRYSGKTNPNLSLWITNILL